MKHIKKNYFMLFITLLVGLTLCPLSAVKADSTNLISNSSFETSTNQIPDNWQTGKWGDNDATFSYSSDAHSGSKSVNINISSYSNGDAKWYPTQTTTVTPGTSYRYSDFYKSNTTTHIVVVIDKTDNTTAYQEMATASASNTWQQYTTNIDIPTGVQSITIYHLLSSVGSLTIDDVSLSQIVNLITNPSVETNTNSLPDSWLNGTWGDHTTNFSYSDDAFDGNKSLRVDISNYNSGDAKWYFEPVEVVPGDSYTFSDYYKSNISSSVYAAYGDINQNPNYVHLGDNSPSANWQSTNYDLTVPAGINEMTIFHVISNNGWLQTDDFSLINYNLNPISNASMELSSDGQPNSWLHDSWGDNQADFTYISSDGHNSASSAKVTLTSYNSGDAKWYFEPITNLTPQADYQLSIWYKTNTQPQVVVDYTDANNQDQYLTLSTPLPDNNATSVWQNYKTVFSLPTGAKTATVFMLISSNGWLQTDDYTILPHYSVGLSSPLLSLAFDDGLESTYDNGLPILDKYGLVSTQYIISGLLNTSGYMSNSMVESMNNDNQEIASHTVTHPDLTTLTDSQLDDELNISQTSLRNLFGTSTAINFASPMGKYNQNVINAIKKYYQSNRTTDVGYNTKDNFNAYDILVQNVTSQTTVNDVSSWINKAISEKAWLVIVYHGVSSTSTDDYNTTPSNLDSELEMIKNSGISVQTINQALSNMLN